jgi:hypothetical protein
MRQLYSEERNAVPIEQKTVSAAELVSMLWLREKFYPVGNRTPVV